MWQSNTIIKHTNISYVLHTFIRTIIIFKTQKAKVFFKTNETEVAQFADL